MLKVWNVRKVLFLGATMLFLGGCKSAKTIIESGEADSRLSAKRIIDNHYANQVDFKTLSGRIKIDYDNGEQNQGVTVSLRMEKDKMIWISAPLGMVKAQITPTRVSFYNKLQNEYFDGHYGYLSELLGTDLDFDKVQNLLLGNAIFDLKGEKYVSEIRGKNYGLKPKKAQELFKLMFLVEPQNFKMASQEISQPIEKRQLKAKYTYQNIYGKALPNEIHILASEDDGQTTIALDFKSIELDRALNFPYKIPRGYDEIILK